MSQFGNAANFKFICSFCGKHASKFFLPILRHIGEVHQFEPNFSIICGLNGCTKKYTSFGGYKTHLYRKHRDYVVMGEVRFNTSIRMLCSTKELIYIFVRSDHGKYH